ncbi:MAG: sarcosine oxidase subunit gamma family protein [Gammaproteobacteria bacterium]
MTPSSRGLMPRSAFPQLQSAHLESRGVHLSARESLGIATVMAKQGQAEALRESVRKQFGIELPSGPLRAHRAGVSFVGTGPDTWLATCEPGSNRFAGPLAEMIGEVAAVTDQGDAYAVLRLRGPRACEALQKLVPIDLHQRSFRQGHAACTVAAEISVIFWRLENDDAGSSVFELAIPRSFADSVWHALMAGMPGG